MLNRLGLPARPVLSASTSTEPFLYATTTAPGQTVTIHRITPTGGSIVISWGDGEATTVADGVTTAQAHVYATAATYEIRVTPLVLVTQLEITGAQLSGFNSALLSGNVMTYFACYAFGTAKTSIINSSDMASWNPSTFRIFSIPAGNYYINSSVMSGWTGLFYFQFTGIPSGTYVINSADFSLWNVTYLQIGTIPSGTYNINTSNVSGTNLVYCQLSEIPPASTTWNITASDFSGFRKCTTLQMQGNSLTQAQVDATLWGLYQASVSPRTSSGGTINVGGTNAAPSGIYQPSSACPVTVATPGKEVANELVNDGCAVGFNKWTTVTFTV